MSRRLSHLFAQFDSRVCLSHWSTFDQQVRLPVWLAAPSYPIIIGTWIIVFCGALSFEGFRTLFGEYTSRTHEAPDATEVGEGVIVLRTYGDDGGFLFPSHDRPRFRSMRKVRSLEELVVTAASSAGLTNVFGFHDHGSSSYPKGVRQVHVEHDSWEEQFDALLPSVAAIVVMPTPDKRIGSGLRQELTTIRDRDLTSRVVVIGPPDIDVDTRRALHEIYGLLGWPIPRASYLAAHEGASGKLVVIPSIGGLDTYRAERYQQAVDGALVDILARRTA